MGMRQLSKTVNKHFQNLKSSVQDFQRSKMPGHTGGGGRLSVGTGKKTGPNAFRHLKRPTNNKPAKRNKRQRHLN